MVGGLFGLVGLLLGSFGAAASPLGGGTSLVGPPFGLGDGLVVAPFVGQFGRFLSQVGGFLGPVGVLLGTFGPLARLLGQVTRVLGQLAGLDSMLLGAGLGLAAVRVTGLTAHLRPRPCRSSRQSSRRSSAASCSSSTARRATLYGSPVSAIRWRAAIFRALSSVMIVLPWRGGPRLLAMVNGPAITSAAMTRRHPSLRPLSSLPPTARADRWLGSGQVVRCHYG